MLKRTEGARNHIWTVLMGMMRKGDFQNTLAIKVTLVAYGISVLFRLQLVRTWVQMVEDRLVGSPCPLLRPCVVS